MWAILQKFERRKSIQLFQRYTPWPNGMPICFECAKAHHTAHQFRRESNGENRSSGLNICIPVHGHEQTDYLGNQGQTHRGQMGIWPSSHTQDSAALCIGRLRSTWPMRSCDVSGTSECYQIHNLPFLHDLLMSRLQCRWVTHLITQIMSCSEAMKDSGTAMCSEDNSKVVFTVMPILFHFWTIVL